MKTHLPLFIILIILFSDQANAVNTIKPGSYISEHDRGSLQVSKSDNPSILKFSMDALGANGHVCDVEGEIVNNRAETDEKCIIKFMPQTNRIEIELSEECRNYCGARAWFSNTYFLPIPLCEKSQNIRASFGKLYQSKKYNEAKQVLTELYSKCERFMYWHTTAEILNDLAITEYHLGDKTACLKVLDPLKKQYVDETPYFTPMDEEWAENMTKITRFNWKKCGGIVPEFNQSAK
jgi:hypothetical protein